jgi:hypothetical protein
MARKLDHTTHLKLDGPKGRAYCSCGWKGRKVDRVKAYKAAQRHADKYSGVLSNGT